MKIELTTDHPASSYNLPVLLVDNRVYGHGDVIAETGVRAYDFLRSISAIGAEIDGAEHLEKWLDLGAAMFPSKMGSRIRQRREELKITQTRLAEMIGSTQRSISNWENGMQEPRAEALIKLAAALGVKIESLMY